MPTPSVFVHDYEQIKATPDVWACCQFAGILRILGTFIENRNCPNCQSTISKPVTREQAFAVIEQQRNLIERTLHAISD